MLMRPKNLKYRPTYIHTYIYIPTYIYQSDLPKGRSFTANAETKVVFLYKGRSSTANSGTKMAVF